MIRYIEKGDIFRIEGVSSYAHGCNCAGAMGKGIAVQFKDKYPEMYFEYKLLCKENKFCPGDVFDYDYGNRHIYNLGTQATWRTRAGETGACWDSMGGIKQCRNLHFRAGRQD